MFPIIETERLILREIKEEDAEDVFAILSNNEVTKYYGQESLVNLQQAKEVIQFFKQSYEASRGIRWGIERKGTNGLIGTIGFNAWSPKQKRADIGYEIHPERWRKGYAAEAITSLLSFGFDNMDLNRIGAVVFLENEASNKLLTKVGFQKEGILRNYIHQNDVSHDTNVYSIIR